MTMTEERMQILNMVAEGTITAEEGARLLAALEATAKKDSRPAATEGSSSRWLRIRVTDLATGRHKLNVNLPLSLVEIGTRIGARFAPDLESMDLREIVAQIKSGTQGKIVEIEDVEDGELVEIYVE